jgi:NitT/TauT family transport system ATP-binding protein
MTVNPPTTGAVTAPANAASSPPALETVALGRRFRRDDGRVVDAVKDISLAIRPGEFVCVLGRSGHGKSTLLNLIAGLDRPTSGTIETWGKAVNGPGADRSLVFQQDSVFPWMRVIENIEYGLRCRGIDRQARRDTAARFLAAVGLDGLERAWPRELSGGMRKRVAIASAFACGADLLLLDEPFGALDYVTRRQLHALLLRLWAEERSHGERERAVMFVTHDVDEALTLADRVLVIRDGGVGRDLRIDLPRPRSSAELASPRCVDLRNTLLADLGVDDEELGFARHAAAA